jgi:hypothetical protein
MKLAVYLIFLSLVFVSCLLADDKAAPTRSAQPAASPVLAAEAKPATEPKTIEGPIGTWLGLQLKTTYTRVDSGSTLSDSKQFGGVEAEFGHALLPNLEATVFVDLGFASQTEPYRGAGAALRCRNVFGLGFSLAAQAELHDQKYFYYDNRIGDDFVTQTVALTGLSIRVPLRLDEYDLGMEAGAGLVSQSVFDKLVTTQGTYEFIGLHLDSGIHSGWVSDLRLMNLNQNTYQFPTHSESISFSIGREFGWK